MSEAKRQAVRVTYMVDEQFIVPKGIDLNNKEQVEEFWVKWNTLYIRLSKNVVINGTVNEDGDDDEEVEGEVDVDGSVVVEVKCEGWCDDFDFKRPSEQPVVVELTQN